MPFPPLVEPVASLDDDERRRTARHLALAGFGETAQRRLAAARIAVIGAGGLGSPAILALAAAGVGELIVIDDDTVELSNLQRQILHRVEDVGTPKVDSAVRVAADLAPAVRVRAVRERLDDASAVELLQGADVVIDGSDTFATRAAVATACEHLGIPLVWGTVQEFTAQVTVFWSRPPAPAAGVVLSDLHRPEAVGEPPTCVQVGVLGALCLQVGGLLATEAIKLVTGVGDSLLGRVLLIDALRATQREVPLLPSEAPRSIAPPSETPADVEPRADEVATSDLDDRRAAGAIVLDVREPDETARGTIPGAVLVPLADVLAAPTGVGSGPFVVVCHAGSRAHRAASALLGVGVPATVLRGGMRDWEAAR